jgi:hypothetical protein
MDPIEIDALQEAAEGNYRIVGYITKPHASYGGPQPSFRAMMRPFCYGNGWDLRNSPGLIIAWRGRQHYMDPDRFYEVSLKAGFGSICNWYNGEGCPSGCQWKCSWLTEGYDTDGDGRLEEEEALYVYFDATELLAPREVRAGIYVRRPEVDENRVAVNSMGRHDFWYIDSACNFSSLCGWDGSAAQWKCIPLYKSSDEVFNGAKVAPLGSAHTWDACYGDVPGSACDSMGEIWLRPPPDQCQSESDRGNTWTHPVTGRQWVCMQLDRACCRLESEVLPGYRGIDNCGQGGSVTACNFCGGCYLLQFPRPYWLEGPDVPDFDLATSLPLRGAVSYGEPPYWSCAGGQHFRVLTMEGPDMEGRDRSPLAVADHSSPATPYKLERYTATCTRRGEPEGDPQCMTGGPEFVWASIEPWNFTNDACPPN